jgi:hypothetical protein
VKTISLKKVSAVAVAALAIGSFTAIAPANAAEKANGSANGGIAALTLGKVTTTPTVGSVVVVKLGMSVNAIATNPASADTYKIQGALTTVPSGGSVGLSSVTTGAGATQTGTLTPILATAGTFFTATPAASVVTFTAAANGAVLGTFAAETDTRMSAQTVTNVGGYNFTPTKAGTYVLTVWQDTNGTGDTPSVGEVSQTLSITVAAAATLQASSTVIRAKSAATAAVTQDATTTQATYTAALDALPYAAAKGTSAATNRVAQIALVMLNNDGTAGAGLHSVTATMSGSGLVTCNNSGTASDGTLRSSTYTTLTGENVAVCHVNTDGTSGAGTVTFTVTDASTGVSTVVGSRTINSWGSVSKLAVSSTNFTVGKAGSPTGGALAARAAATEVGTTAGIAAGMTVNSATTSTPAFIVKATDSSGAVANTLAVPAIVSSAAAVVSGGTCILDNGTDADYSSGTGVGVYNCKFDTAANAVSGSKATLTIRVLDPADPLAVAYLTTTVDVTVGGSIATETIAFDKTSYAPGEAMVITRTAKDSAGNPVFDGAAAPAITFSKSVGGTAPGASIYVGGKKSSTSSTGVVSVFAPAVGGSFSMNATSGNTAGSALTASSTVTDGNAALLTQIDALNAKIVALNALIAKIMKKLGVK